MEDRKIFLNLYEVKMKNNIMITVNAERYEIHKNIFEGESDLIYFMIGNMCITSLLKNDIKDIKKW